METKASWLLDMVDQGKIVIEKCCSEENLADIGTKALDAARRQKLAAMIGFGDMSTQAAQVRAVTTTTRGGWTPSSTNAKVWISFGIMMQAIGTNE